MTWDEVIKLDKAVVREVSTRLKTYGFRKRVGSLFTVELSEDVLGYLGFDSTQQDGPPTVKPEPILGVKYQAISKIASSWAGFKYHPYCGPLFASNVGNLMPERKTRSWQFRDATKLDPEMSDMVGAIVEHGLPFLRRNAVLEQGLETVNRIGVASRIPYTLIVGHLYVGNRERALELLQYELDEWEVKDGMPFENLQRFRKHVERAIKTGKVEQITDAEPSDNSARSKLTSFRRRLSGGTKGPQTTQAPARPSRSIAHIIKAARLACREEIEKVGFQHRRGGIFTMPLNSEVIGWVGLGSESRRGDGAFRVHPSIAVRHQQLHKLEDELAGRKPHAYIPPSVITDLWHAMDPKPNDSSWEFWSVEQAQSVARRIAEAMREFGVPWLKSRNSLEAIAGELDAGNPIGVDGAARIACARLLLGRWEQAEKLTYGLATWTLQQERPDIPAYADFRAFAARLREYVRENKNSSR